MSPPERKLNNRRLLRKKMRLKPVYPKYIISNPFYVGLMIGFFIASGFTMIFYAENWGGIIYGSLLFLIGIVYFYLKEKEFG
jgi:polyferredoxin